MRSVQNLHCERFRRSNWLQGLALHRRCIRFRIAARLEQMNTIVWGVHLTGLRRILAHDLRVKPLSRSAFVQPLDGIFRLNSSSSDVDNESGIET